MYMVVILIPYSKDMGLLADMIQTHTDVSTDMGVDVQINTDADVLPTVLCAT